MKQRITGRITAISVLLAGGLLLAGCNGEPEAEEGPPQSLGDRQMQPQPTEDEGVQRPQQPGMPAADVKRTDDD
ncbi:hypothetical protein [Thioalkalivibrio sp. ALJ24]|uniref:hypothetical protein n=1 Tax=Thioalkalivibrio sp. ALJ24 TaxID=545276 RepID=UPI0003A65087|nr:hypothetical protein [Thioalkalivibrio sp. ALJ24]